MKRNIQIQKLIKNTSVQELYTITTNTMNNLLNDKNQDILNPFDPIAGLIFLRDAFGNKTDVVYDTIYTSVNKTPKELGKMIGLPDKAIDSLPATTILNRFMIEDFVEQKKLVRGEIKRDEPKDNSKKGNILESHICINDIVFFTQFLYESEKQGLNKRKPAPKLKQSKIQARASEVFDFVGSFLKNLSEEDVVKLIQSYRDNQ